MFCVRSTLFSVSLSRGQTGKRARVTKSWNGSLDNQLSIVKGETLMLKSEKPTANGWMLASKIDDPTKMGFIPSSFYQVIAKAMDMTKLAQVIL